MKKLEKNAVKIRGNFFLGGYSRAEAHKQKLVIIKERKKVIVTTLLLLPGLFVSTFSIFFYVKTYQRN